MQKNPQVPAHYLGEQPVELVATFGEPVKRPASDISPKISGVAAAGALATIGVFVASQFGLVIPPGVEAAIAVVIATVVGYLIPDRR